MTKRSEAMPDPTAPYLARVRATYPELAISSVRVVETESQFNDVLVVNEKSILRFSRNKEAASALTREVAVLRGLQGRLPLPVPNPTLMGYDAATGAIDWMSYALLPGEPLWSEELDALDKADQRQIALQLAGFLHALHTLPPTEVDIAALSCYGDLFLTIGVPAYPGIATLLPRARRYRATFALQQALWALRDGDVEAFEDGISAYR